MCVCVCVRLWHDTQFVNPIKPISIYYFRSNDETFPCIWLCSTEWTWCVLDPSNHHDHSLWLIWLDRFRKHIKSKYGFWIEMMKFMQQSARFVYAAAVLIFHLFQFAICTAFFELPTKLPAIPVTNEFIVVCSICDALDALILRINRHQRTLRNRTKIALVQFRACFVICAAILIFQTADALRMILFRRKRTLFDKCSHNLCCVVVFSGTNFICLWKARLWFNIVHHSCTFCVFRFIRWIFESKSTV